VMQPSIAKKGGTFWPTDRYPRRNPSPHGKARYEGDVNLDPGGEWQLKRCIRYVAENLQEHILSNAGKSIERLDMGNIVSLIGTALEDEGQIVEWGLTEGEVVTLKELKGQAKLFQLTDDLRAKKFLERAAVEVRNACKYYHKTQSDAKAQVEEEAVRIKKVTAIPDQKYTLLVEGRMTDGRQKRITAMQNMMKQPSPRADLKEVRAIVANHLSMDNNDDLVAKLAGLVEDEQNAMAALKCDSKEAKKLAAAQGDALLRLASSLCKRAKFVSRMDSYNYKTRS